MLFNTYSTYANTTLDYDVLRSEDGVTLRIDIPGIDPETIDLTLNGRSLRLEANRDSSIPEGVRIVGNRRRNGSIAQSFQLGERLDAEQLTADYEFGVLTVTIPVAESAKPRKISVGGPNETAELEAA